MTLGNHRVFMRDIVKGQAAIFGAVLVAVIQGILL